MVMDMSPRSLGGKLKTRRANGVGIVPELEGLGSGRCGVSLWAWRPGKKICVPATRPSGWKRRIFLWSQGETAILFCSDLQLIGWGPPTLGRTISFAQSINLILNSPKDTLTGTPRIILDQIFGHPSQADKINHHNLHWLRFLCYIFFHFNGVEIIHLSLCLCSSVSGTLLVLIFLFVRFTYHTFSLVPLQIIIIIIL